MIRRLTRIVPSATITILALLGLLIWRIWSPEAHKARKVKALVHTHTMTFTCDSTCTDLTKVPELIPW